MFIHFLCLCPLRLAIMLNFNISKVAYWRVWVSCCLSHNEPTRNQPPLDLKLGNGRSAKNKSPRPLVALPRVPTRMSKSSV